MVSEFVRNRRKELGLTQQQLADKASVSLSVAKRFEAPTSHTTHYDDPQILYGPES